MELKEYIDKNMDKLEKEYYNLISRNSPENLPLDDDTENLFESEDFYVFIVQNWKEFNESDNVGLDIISNMHENSV